MRALILSIFLTVISFGLFAQEQSDTVTVLTKQEIRAQKKLARQERDSLRTKPVKDPKRPYTVKTATLLSAFLPGAGQIYNHRAKKYFNQFKAMKDRQKVHAWWKVPLIYGGLGVSGYYIYINNVEVNSLRSEYNARIDEGISFKSDKYAQYDNSAILTIHDQYQTWRDVSILSFSLIYLLNVLDAAVEGHFANFDISENLSMEIRPSYQARQNAFGLGLALNLK
jgi:hypothetical protein